MTDLAYDSAWWAERPYEEDPPSDSDNRTALERDRDRICHSRGFRRLAGKTQVIGTPWADDYRNRLTHTIEVAQVGRTLARKHKVDEALVEAACLAHDIGHPPFGHAGERRLNELMDKWGGFDANAQTLRVLRKLEVKDAGQHGLNLTRATYWSILKYPYRRSGIATGADISSDADLTLQDGLVTARRRFLYDDDLDSMVRDERTFEDWLGDGKLTPAAPPDSRVMGPPNHTLACNLMDWADDVAYAIHDFEDAVLARFITRGAIKRVRQPLLDAVRSSVATKYFATDDLALTTAFSAYEREIDGVLDAVQEAIDAEAALRPETRKWFGQLVDAASLVPPSVTPDETTAGYRLDRPRKYAVLVALLSHLGYELLIRDERIVRYLRKGTMMLERSFNELMSDPKVVDERVGQLLPRHIAAPLQDADEGERARAICDFLASLSEPALARFYSTLFESTGGSPFN